MTDIRFATYEVKQVTGGWVVVRIIPLKETARRGPFRSVSLASDALLSWSEEDHIARTAASEAAGL